MDFRFTEVIVVVAGHQNPAIISHRFLIDEGIVGSEIPEPQPLTTPVFSHLVYENFRIQVDPTRLQIVQAYSPGQLPFVGRIAAKYYNCLKYTPVSAYGVNLVGEVSWGGEAGYRRFRDSTFLKSSALADCTADKQWKLGYIVQFRDRCFVSRISLDPPDEQWKSVIGANCHRDLGGDNSVGTLVSELEDISPAISTVERTLSRFLNGG